MMSSMRKIVLLAIAVMFVVGILPAMRTASAVGDYTVSFFCFDRFAVHVISGYQSYEGPFYSNGFWWLTVHVGSGQQLHVELQNTQTNSLYYHRGYEKTLTTNPPVPSIGILWLKPFVTPENSFGALGTMAALGTALAVMIVFRKLR
jgi:hypothetical protein